jgi:hypothetical protein
MLLPSYAFTKKPTATAAALIASLPLLLFLLDLAGIEQTRNGSNLVGVVSETGGDGN